MGDSVVGEGPNDQKQSVSGPKLTDNLGSVRRVGLGLQASGDVDVADLGRSCLLRLEKRGETVQPLVGDLNHRSVRLAARGREGGDLDLSPRQRVENRRLPGGAEAHNANFHE